MKITSLMLDNFKPFQLGGIQRLNIRSLNNILVILAANGYGKSSLLREMKPLPANRSDYEADGKKKVGILHNNSEFILTSDFSNRTSPHSFEMDGVEHNTGGTTAVQLELIEKYIGYTQAIDDIISGFHKFSTMAPGNRRTLLLVNNPFELGFILEKHKSANAQVRAYQNNLTRLYERKAILETEFLEQALEDQLRQEEEVLKQTLSMLVGYDHRIGEQLRILETTQSRPTYDPEEVARYIRAVRHRAIQYSDVPRQGLSEYLEKIKTTIAEDDTRLTIITSQIQQIAGELDKYQTHIAEGSQKDVIQDLRQMLDQTMCERDGLESQLINNPFDEVLLVDIDARIAQLIEILQAFSSGSGDLLAPREIQKLKDRHNRYQQKMFEYRLPYEQAVRERDNASLQLQSMASPDDKCVSAVCPLLLEFRTFSQSIKADEKLFETRVEKYRHKVVRYELLVRHLGQKIETYEVYLPHLNALTEFFREYGFLKVPLAQLPMIQTLKNNPFLIVTKIKEHVLASKKVHRYKAVSTEIDHLTEKYLRAQKSDVIDKQFVQEIIDTKKNELESIRLQYTQVDQHLHDKRELVRQIISYQDTLEKLSYYKQQGEMYLQDAIRTFDRDTYRDLRKQINDEKVTVALRLNEIGTILRNQETLRVRYQEEVIKQIEVLEHEKHRMSLIEKALSPNSGIPHQYMVSYLNALLKTMNYFISRVFSYPMELILLKDDDVLTYKFPIKIGGDVTLSDINMGSSAQKEMIDITFMLAQMVQLKLSDYGLKIDELDRAFDSHHRQKLLELFSSLVDDGICSQLFLVSHHAVMSQGLSNADNLVLNDANITLPAIYNTNVEME